MLVDVSNIPKHIVEEVLEPEARLHAQDLAKLTFPRNAADGRNKIERSIRFIFKSPTGPDAKKLTNPGLVAALDRLKNHPKKAAVLLRNVWGGGEDMTWAEPTKETLEPLRRFDRKNHGHPRSRKNFLASEASIRRTIKSAKEDVGGAKKGWTFPGVKAPAWVFRANGPSGDHSISKTETLTRISVENPTRAMADIESRTALSEFVLKLRGKKIMAKIQWLLNNQKRNAA